MSGTRSTVTLERVKTLLWAVMGVLAVVTVARFAHGMGATTGLTDVAPWGFWKVFHVLAGVALAAGGFVIAATVYIFGIEKYHCMARPAILTALLGYIAVAVGLIYDLGIPWNIWHPLIFPQHHSVLFEVAMCVMLYLTVLSLEFTPTILEHPLFHRPFFEKLLALVKRITVPVVIAGVVLCTLHQSSLGSLFLIQPYRVHPLWYSPILYVLFFVSAVGLGLMMVVIEALVSRWLFGHRLRADLLAGLGRVASMVLALYLLIRLGDLWYRGVLPGALDGSWQAGLFMFELLISAAIPAVLLAFRRIRHSIAGLTTCATMTVLGVIGHRFNISLIAFQRPEGMTYFPTWTELAISAGIVAGAVLVFIFFNENLRIVDREPEKTDSAKASAVTSLQDAGFRPAVASGFIPSGVTFERHSLAFVIAAALAVGFLPEDAIFGPKPATTPVHASRNLEALAVAGEGNIRREFHIASLSGNIPARLDPQPVDLKLIDGNRNWRFVPFAHDDHIAALGDRESCRLCHHQNMTFDRNTSCSECHRDMYEVTDTFDHVLHIYKLGGNHGCAVCHPAESERKSRETALACWACHGDMVVKGSIIPPAAGGLTGFAPGYMDAMHGLCIRCHEEKALKQPETYGAEFARCDVCHREFKDTEHRRMAPYVPMPEGHVPAGAGN